jgi:hypothetical protein
MWPDWPDGLTRRTPQLIYLSLDIALFLFNEISREMSKQMNYEILKEDNGLLKKANERLWRQIEILIPMVKSPPWNQRAFSSCSDESSTPIP